MPLATASDLLDAVRRNSALDAKQLEQATQLLPQCAEPKEFAKQLIQRGWLTPWQVNQLAKGQTLLLQGYVLLQLIGEGGMGQVYKARQLRLRRMAALKIIRQECLASPAAVERFLREAEAAARLSHPNIVTVYDAGEANGTHFLAMEFIDGTDLAKVVKQSGPLPVGQACNYVLQAAQGLQHAHEQGLVHRDIKPSNLMLTQRGVIKVMDMGLARLNAAAGGEAPSGITASGSVMGTPDYIAPEQAMNARTVDIRADIYSLGCSLYNLLTGRLPFTGDSLTEKLIKHQLHEPEPLEKLRPDLPRALPFIVRAMMAKAPDQRHQTPAAVVQALQPYATAPEIAAPPVAAIVPAAALAPAQRAAVDEEQATVPAGAVPLGHQDTVKESPGGTKRASLAGFTAELASGRKNVLVGAVVGGAALLFMLSCGGLALLYALWPRHDTRPRASASTSPAPTRPSSNPLFANARELKLAANGSGRFDGQLQPAAQEMLRFVAPVGGTMSVRLERADGNLDPELWIYDSREQEIAYNDDYDIRISLDSQVTITVTAGQTYYAKAGSVRGSAGRYFLIMTTRGSGPTPGSSFATAREFRLAADGSGRIDGTLEFPGEDCIFRLAAPVAGQMTVRLERTGVTSLDPELWVYDAEQRLLAQNDDLAPGILDSQVIVQVQARQTYFAKATGHLNTTGPYRLLVSTVASRSDARPFAPRSSERVLVQGRPDRIDGAWPFPGLSLR